MIKTMEISNDIPILQTLRSHSSDVTSCDFGAKFQLASGSGDKEVHVWEWQVGKGYVDSSYSPFTPHKYAVTCVRFSPQGTMLASASIDGTTMLWNVSTGVRIATFVQPSGSPVRVCRFSPDSTLLATADDDGTVGLWDLVLRNLVRTLQHLSGSVQGIGFTPDASYLLTTCTQGVMKLWEVLHRNEDEPTACLASIDDGHDLGVMGCDFSPTQECTAGTDGAGAECDVYLLATCGNDNFVKLWVTAVGRRLKHQSTTPCRITERLQLQGHSSAVCSVRFSPGGNYIASTSIDKTTRIWEMGGNCLAVLEGHSRYVVCCSFSRDGSLLATGSNDKTLILWDLTKSLTKDSVLVPPASLFSQCVNLGGACKPASEQDLVKRAEGDKNEVKLLQRLDCHDGHVNSVHFHGNNMLGSASGDKMVRMWARSDATAGRFAELGISPLEGHRYSVNQVEFSPNGRLLASCSLDGSTILWDVKSGKRARPCFQASGGGVRTCRFSPDGHLLVTAGDDNMATVFNTSDMAVLMSVSGHSDAVVSVAFTSDSQYLVTASSDGNLKLWSVAPCSEQCLHTREEAHDLGVQSCDFSPAEGSAGSERGATRRYLLASCGNDSLVKLWHVGTPRYHGDSTYGSALWKTFAGHGGNVMCVRFAPGTGDILASTATDQTARLWNTYTGDCVHVLENHDSMVITCAFSADATFFATGSMDKTVIVWELPQQLAFQTVAAVRLRGNRKKLVDWGVEDVDKWLVKLGLASLQQKPREHNLVGQQLLVLPEEEILKLVTVDEGSDRQHFSQQLFWLRKEDAGLLEVSPDKLVPHEFLCPITHEIMRDPVTCSDGFTYERAAINEWFLSGKFSSPMTNSSLTDTHCVTNSDLRSQICRFLYGENPAA